jgi:hypothetical protein
MLYTDQSSEEWRQAEMGEAQKSRGRGDNHWIITGDSCPPSSIRAITAGTGRVHLGPAGI